MGRAVYAFDCVTGLCTPRDKIVANDKAEYALFGAAIALDGDRLVVGAPGTDNGRNARFGAAYVFSVREDGRWTQQQIFFVSPNQINYLMPSGLANGAATVTIANGQGAAVESRIQISAVAPGLFSANASGGGPAAALALRVRANGQQAYESVTRYDAQSQSFVLEPIDLSNPAEQVYLILFGAGIRHRGALQDVTLDLGGMKSPVSYAGASPEITGVDQINAQLPRSLAGRGEVDVSLSVAGKAANTVRVSIR